MATSFTDFLFSHPSAIANFVANNQPKTNVSSSAPSQPKTAQDLVNMGYPGYQGWSDNAAIQDFKATGGSGKGGGNGSSGSSSSTSSSSPLEDVNKMITDTFSNLYGQAQKAFGDYQTTHPFALDQVLASSTAQAKEQVDPYYNETLKNYLTGVNNRISRSKEDTTNVINELNAQTSNFTANTKLQLQQALLQSGQGFADAGLLSSGAALQGAGVQNVQSGNTLADFLRGQQFKTTQANLANTRTLQDIGLESTATQRDIARQQYTDEQTTANQLAKESGQNYVRGFQQTLPPQLQANTGFDLLSQLGIPS